MTANPDSNWTGCWLWLGGTNGAGYGTLRLAPGGPKLLAHRVSYETHVGPIPAGLEIDHLCRTPLCVNPAHLEPVTHAENMRRVAERQLACRRAGHDWSDERNVFTRKDGRRCCRECARQADRQRGRKAA